MLPSNNPHLTKISINQDQKKILEELTGCKIYLRNAFDVNQSEIQGLVEQGQKNSLEYLNRNRLGQKLNIFDDNRLFTNIVDLQAFLQLPKTPRRIECYDISHLGGTFVYGSMVTFIDGRPVPKYYRLFKCKDQNNDFKNHAAVMRRRLARGVVNSELETPDKGWVLPDLIIVDGGKGQLTADLSILAEFCLENSIQMVSLAKREEEVFCRDMDIFDSSYDFGSQGGLLLPHEQKSLFQRIRDEAHRFAITNNRKARLKQVTKTSLDDIPGIGEITKKKLLIRFGSTANIVNNLSDNPEIFYELVGKSVLDKLKKKFGVA